MKSKRLSELSSRALASSFSASLTSAGGGASVGYTNAQTLSSDLIIEDNFYASLYGPVTVDEGTTIDIGSNSFLKIEAF